ncbi:MAG: hypothetical protein NZ960_03360 [Candidatus Kapabacteria bacterium]|nr:hypothetical protein [Candidatus Kapabacteria bacterium]MDW8012303.1 hypothetical protein [Bacteroidota bacterium]
MGRQPKLLLGGVAVLWLLVVAISQSWNFLYADDALPFVVRIHEGMSHPHHLIVGFLGKVNAALGWTGPLEFRQTLSFVRFIVGAFSLVGILCVGYLAWLWWKGTWAIAAAMLTMAASYGFWAYSVVPDFYVPGIAMVLTSAMMVERAQQSRQWGWIVGAAVCVWTAALFHQSYALFAVIASLLLLAARRPKPAAALLCLSSVLIGVSYLVAFWLQSEYRDIVSFVLGYALHMQFTPYDHLQPLTPVYAAVGIMRAWTFPEYFLRVGDIWEYVQQRWSMKLFLDERFLLRSLPVEAAVLLGGIGLIGTVVVIWTALKTFRQRHRELSGHLAYWSLVGWGVGLAFLAILWEPSSNEFWLWMIPLGALGVAGVRSHGSRVMASVAVGAIAVSTAPVIWLYRSPDNDIYAVNKRYRAQLLPEDVVIAGDFHGTLALNRLYPTTARELQFTLGRLELSRPELWRALERLAAPTSTGRLILDPLIAMPHLAEIALRQKLPGYSEERMLEVLRAIVTFCVGDSAEVEALRNSGLSLPSQEWNWRRHRRIPVFAVRREGGGVVEFRVRSLPWVQWME